jgi:hypothetical protein
MVRLTVREGRAEAIHPVGQSAGTSTVALSARGVEYPLHLVPGPAMKPSRDMTRCTPSVIECPSKL